MHLNTTRLPARQIPRLLGTFDGRSWEEHLYWRINTPLASLLLDALAAEYRRDGGFEVPLLWEVDPSNGRAHLVNGVHRMIVAGSMNGEVELHRGWLPDGDAAEQFVCLTFEAEVPGHYGPGRDVETILPLFRSFRLPSGRWVNSDTYVDQPREGRFEGWWQCPHALADELTAAVIHRFEAAGGRAELVDVELRIVW